jgi:hypothetical protein
MSTGRNNERECYYRQMCVNVATALRDTVKERKQGQLFGA